MGSDAELASEAIFTGKCPGILWGCPGEISGGGGRLCLGKICRGEVILRGMSGRYLEGLSGVRVRISLYDYKSLRITVMIWTTLVNTHTHTHTDRKTDRQLLSADIL